MGMTLEGQLCPFCGGSDGAGPLNPHSLWRNSGTACYNPLWLFFLRNGFSPPNTSPRTEHCAFMSLPFSTCERYRSSYSEEPKKQSSGSHILNLLNVP